VAVAAGEDAYLIRSTAPAEGRTNELTVYPADLGMSVPMSKAEFTFSAAMPGSSTGGRIAAGNPAGSAAESSFTIWPTGALAILAVAALAALLIAANRNEPARPRR
jgi:hypothetical protein